MHHPVVKLKLYDQDGIEGWQNYPGQGASCPDPFPQDVYSIAPDATYIWSSDLLIANMARPSLHLEAGVPYTLTADLVLWHEGDLSQVGTPTIPQGNDVVAQITITFA